MVEFRGNSPDEERKLNALDVAGFTLGFLIFAVAGWAFWFGGQASWFAQHKNGACDGGFHPREWSRPLQQGASVYLQLYPTGSRPPIINRTQVCKGREPKPWKCANL